MINSVHRTYLILFLFEIPHFLHQISDLPTIGFAFLNNLEQKSVR